MVLNYGNSPIPSDSYTVRQGGTIQVAAAFERSIGLVGVADYANGTASANTVYEIDNESDAEDRFGTNSELAQQVELAYENGVTTVTAVAVDETDTTDTVTGSDSGTLDNAPVFNPELHSQHSISATDTVEGESVTVNIVYERGTLTTPSASNTINLNPVKGEWQADESSDYEISYTYGDYATAITELTNDDVQRQNVVLTEAESLGTDLDSDLQDAADAISFGNGVIGVHPFADPDQPDTSNYSDGIESERISLVASPYGYTDDAETNLVRTHAAVAAETASLPLGVSATNNSVSGLTGLRTDLSPQEAKDLTDSQVLPLLDYPPVTIVKDMTSSTTQKFERIYTMNVIDEVLTLSHDINSEFVGEQTSEENINIMRRSLRNMLLGLTREDPPLLDTAEDERPYAVDVSRDDTNDNLVNVQMGIDVIGVIDDIDVTLRVGDIIRSEVS